MFSWTCAKEIWRGTWREAWLSLVVVGMREGTHSLAAHSPKGGITVHVCFLRCMAAVVEVRCLQWKSRKEGLFSALSFSLLLWFGIVLATLCVKCQCLITTFVKVSLELDLLQFLKLISAVE